MVVQQFSTRAESVMYRAWGGDIINMSVLPEAKLAREAELSYVLIATGEYDALCWIHSAFWAGSDGHLNRCLLRMRPATDYDAWRPSSEAVTVAEVIQTLHTNVAASQRVTLALLDKVHASVADPKTSEIVRAVDGSMKMSIMTRSEFIPEKVKERLRYIHEWFGQ